MSDKTAFFHNIFVTGLTLQSAIGISISIERRLFHDGTSLDIFYSEELFQ